MTSVRDFKGLVGRLKRGEPTGQDIALFKQLVMQLVASLRGVFRVGKPLPRWKRIHAGRLFIGLASTALTLRTHEPVATILSELLEELSGATDEAVEGLRRFLAAGNGGDKNNSTSSRAGV